MRETRIVNLRYRIAGFTAPPARRKITDERETGVSRGLTSYGGPDFALYLASIFREETT